MDGLSPRPKIPLWG